MPAYPSPLLYFCWQSWKGSTCAANRGTPQEGWRRSKSEELCPWPRLGGCKTLAESTPNCHTWCEGLPVLSSPCSTVLPPSISGLNRFKLHNCKNIHSCCKDTNALMTFHIQPDFFGFSPILITHGEEKKKKKKSFCASNFEHVVLGHINVIWTFLYSRSCFWDGIWLSRNAKFKLKKTVMWKTWKIPAEETESYFFPLAYS